MKLGTVASIVSAALVLTAAPHAARAVESADFVFDTTTDPVDLADGPDYDVTGVAPVDDTGLSCDVVAMVMVDALGTPVDVDSFCLTVADGTGGSDGDYGSFGAGALPAAGPATYALYDVTAADQAALTALGVGDSDQAYFDYVVAMDRENLAHLEGLAGPEHRHRVSLFLAHAEGIGGDVPDPYYGGPAGFERVLDLVNGVRLTYPMEDRAMRFANLVGNKFFSLTFSWLLGQPIKDTLCGTKVLRRDVYQALVANRAYFGDFDPFGDFDLLFGAAKLGLEIVEVPIRYRERTYGTTNIQRWRHGWLLLKMCAFAAGRIKFV